MAGRRSIAPLFAGVCLLHAVWAAAADRYHEADRYRAADFRRVSKIDAHVHLNGPADLLIAQAVRDRFRLLTINVDYPDFPPIDVQQGVAVSLRQRYPGRIEFAATLSVAGFHQPGWSDAAIRGIDAALAQGAVGVKIWKNIGMDLRDPDGTFVMPDDARLKAVIDRLEQGHVVLLGHQAEPLNCWLPFAKMTVRSDREYFRAHPQYYMYRHPEMPSHAEQLAARDRMLAAHPSLRFDSLHLASLEWDVDEVAHFLDRFPNANVDLAARMVHLQVQAVHGRNKVRRFMIRYQDRILYGTDIADGPGEADGAAAADARATWRSDWRFLTSAAHMQSADFRAAFRGLALPRIVVDKIYRINAETMYPQFCNTIH